MDASQQKLMLYHSPIYEYFQEILDYHENLYVV